MRGTAAPIYIICTHSSLVHVHAAHILYMRGAATQRGAATYNRTKSFLEEGGCRTRPLVSIPAHSKLVFWY